MEMFYGDLDLYKVYPNFIILFVLGGIKLKKAAKC